MRFTNSILAKIENLVSIVTMEHKIATAAVDAIYAITCDRDGFNGVSQDARYPWVKPTITNETTSQLIAYFTLEQFNIQTTCDCKYDGYARSSRMIATCKMAIEALKDLQNIPADVAEIENLRKTNRELTGKMAELQSIIDHLASTVAKQ